jgi:hypothetical protein
LADKEDFFINEVWGHEVAILGLGEQDIIIPSEQVKTMVGLDPDGNGRILINVQDIEVTHMDHENNKIDYRIIGVTQLSQKWDFGGSNLSPEPLDMSYIDPVGNV